METPNTQVYVTNISASASEKTVTDFFSFCGKINSMTLRTLEGGAKEAVIEFQTDAAAKTALLLTNALIVDRPITVAPYTGAPLQKISEEKVEHETKVSGDQIKHQEHSVPEQQRSQTSVIASMIAAGYSMGADAVDKARAYDEQQGITQTIHAQTEALKAKAQQINEQYKIGETASAWGTAAYGWWSGVDQALGISQTATAIKQSSAAAARAISESEAAQAAGETLEVAKEAIVGAADAVKTSTTRFIDEQPTLKAASTKIQETTNAVSSEVKGVADETTRLIRERDQAKKAGPFDGIDEQQRPAATEAQPEASEAPAPAKPQDTVSL